MSLFDGMSCGQLALQRAGIKVDAYYAAEIDTHAMKVTQHNFPGTIQLGDVTKVRAQALPKIDLIIGGSPCQGFSFAGKGLNFEDERSKLFFEFVRLIKECKPKYFFLENVKMKKEHELVISQYMKVAPIEVNSALVSAQNRVRLYWTNINEKPYGLFDDMMADIPQPKDKGILLKDILETDVPEKFYLSDKAIKYLNRTEMNQRFIQNETDNKGGCITANYHKGVPYNAICVASRGRNPENPKSRESGLETEQMLEPRIDGKTNRLTSVQKDNLVCEIMGDKANTLTPDAYLATGARNRDENGKAVLTSMCDRRLRKLMPVECERLQTVPDGYTSCVSDTQRYRMLGNGWTVSVVSHIFSYLPKEYFEINV